jgi:hypothetical protein
VWLSFAITIYITVPINKFYWVSIYFTYYYTTTTTTITTTTYIGGRGSVLEPSDSVVASARRNIAGGTTTSTSSSSSSSSRYVYVKHVLHVSCGACHVSCAVLFSWMHGICDMCDECVYIRVLVSVIAPYVL